jgi:hypothetical protein
MWNRFICHTAELQTLWCVSIHRKSCAAERLHRGTQNNAAESPYKDGYEPRGQATRDHTRLTVQAYRSSFPWLLIKHIMWIRRREEWSNNYDSYICYDLERSFQTEFNIGQWNTMEVPIYGSMVLASVLFKLGDYGLVPLKLNSCQTRTNTPFLYVTILG